MRYPLPLLVALTSVAAAAAMADPSPEHDPIRKEQRMKDCVAEGVAKHDGASMEQITQACRQAIAAGDYHDPNISLDGMIKQPPPPSP